MPTNPTPRPRGRPRKHSDDLRDTSRVVHVYTTAMEMKLLDSLRAGAGLSRSAYLCKVIRDLAGYGVEDRFGAADEGQQLDLPTAKAS